MKFRPFLLAATAAGLLAAGCDYWRNLVDDKTVATAHLKVKVIDAYTEENLLAVCTDTARGLELQTNDRDGMAELPRAGTGAYIILCQTPWGYYDRIDSFPLTPAGRTVIFKMARLGGEAEWYKEDTLREVRIREKFDTLRFPIDLAINAYPEDIKLERFRYEWTFAKAKHLDLTTNVIPSKYPRLNRTRADLMNVVPGQDTLTLRVWSFLNDPKVPYYIGEFKRPFVWARNIPPKFDFMTVLTREDRFKVGCSGTEDRVLNFRFAASDSDGRCTGVRLTARDTTTSLGKLDTLLTNCNTNVRLPLSSPFDTPSTNSVESMVNTLNVTAYDDNYDSTTVVQEFTTYSNILPLVSASISGFKTVVYTGEPIVMNFIASDLDGSIRKVITSWGLNDANHTHIRTYPIQIDQNVPAAAADTHIYFSPSRPEGYTISIAAYDGCGISGNATLGTVIVRDNTPPEIDLHLVKRDIQDGVLTLRLGIRLKDSEVEKSDDHFTLVKVDWGDGTVEADSTDIPISFDETFTHRYAAPPPTGAGYPVEITVKDSHYRGTTIRDTLIAPP